MDGNNYVKLDPISDAGQTRINRIELRTEVDGHADRTGQPTRRSPAAQATVFYLRLTKNGTSYTGEFSRDGTTWLPAGTVAEPDGEPGLRRLRLRPAGRRPGRHRHVRLLLARRPGRRASRASASPTGGDEFDAGSLDKTEVERTSSATQADLYALEDGWLEMTTVNGDIYTNGDPAPTRNFILQNPTTAGQDWVIETHIDASTISGGYEQAGLLVYDGRRQLHQVRHPLRRRSARSVNRIELRSEIDGAIQTRSRRTRRSRTTTPRSGCA